MICAIKRLFSIGFLFGTHICIAQLTDTFSDGDFTNNPTWSGTADFIINVSSQLQLNNTVASTSRLSTAFAVPSLNNFEWQVYVKQTFAPSGSNFGRVYLASDQSNLSGSLNGYYLQFGEAGSLDAVELFKQTGLTSTSLCRATNGSIASSFNLRVRVLRSNVGEWKLMIDYTGGTNFILEASGTDVTFNSSSFLGVVCVYTASNSNKFFYDDFYVGPEIVDTTSPSIVSINPISSTQLDVNFDEKVDPTSGQLLTNYSVSNDVGNPSSATLQPDDKTIRLTFTQPFPNAKTCQLAVSGVKDLFDNSMALVNKDFLFFQPMPAEARDIIITEIFADPSPTVGLPELEFVEIYNRSNKIFDLQNWKITDGSSSGALPSHLFFPNEYIILTQTSSVAQFSSYGNVLGASNFPTLNNSGDNLVLVDNTDVQIDNLSYTDKWYRDDDKKQGGYTLERIDPANECAEENNWVASEATNGGTPGKQNSVFANMPDLTAPKLVSAIPTSATEIIVRFDEKLSEQIPAVADFVITPTIPVSQIAFVDGSLKTFRLTLTTSLQSGITYTIVAQNIYDCPGNVVASDANSFVFGLPEEADSLDIVINEILFNPRPTGLDFVEIYNNSQKFINLKNWSIANFESGTLQNVNHIAEEDFLLAPNQYIVFNEDNHVIKGEYVQAAEENLFEVENLPGFNDDAGTVALVDPQQSIIDFLEFSDDYHSVFIDDDEGVSLERISFSSPTNDKANWKSASSTEGFATPGFVNSNVRKDNHPAGKIVVSPEIFEPIIGQPSFTQIQYNFEQGGLVANVKILDSQGRVIKRIVNNATLGTEGFFRWDGDTDEGTKARTGYYVVWVEVFNADGALNTFRKRVVVTSNRNN